MPQLSIIVPVYNVQEYLSACIMSILEQTYKDFELILVDDGSTDNSSRICDEFKKKDSRIKVIHKANGGLSDARNEGLRASSGRYISFIDSDDFIKKNMYEILIKELENKNVDFIKSNFDQVLEKKDGMLDNGFKTNKYMVKVYLPEEAIENFFKAEYSNVKPMKSTICDGVYKREIFFEDDQLFIEFPVGKINEDTYIFPKLVFRAKKIAHVNIAFYCYRVREDSIMHSGITVREIESRQLWKSVNDDVLKYTDKYVSICINNHFTRNLKIFERIYYSNYRNEYFRKIREELIKDAEELVKYVDDVRIKRSLALIRCYPLYFFVKKLIGNRIY